MNTLSQWRAAYGAGYRTGKTGTMPIAKRLEDGTTLVIPGPVNPFAEAKRFRATVCRELWEQGRCDGWRDRLTTILRRA